MRRNGTPHLATMTWSSMVSLKCCIALHMLSLEISDNTITFTSSLSRERVNMRHVSQHDVLKIPFILRNARPQRCCHLAGSVEEQISFSSQDAK